MEAYVRQPLVIGFFHLVYFSRQFLRVAAVLCGGVFHGIEEPKFVCLWLSQWGTSPTSMDGSFNCTSLMANNGKPSIIQHLYSLSEEASSCFCTFSNYIVAFETGSYNESKLISNAILLPWPSELQSGFEAYLTMPSVPIFLFWILKFLSTVSKTVSYRHIVTNVFFVRTLFFPLLALVSHKSKIFIWWSPVIIFAAYWIHFLVSNTRSLPTLVISRGSLILPD